MLSECIFTSSARKEDALSDAELSHAAMQRRAWCTARRVVSSRDNLATSHEGSSSIALKIYLGHPETPVVCSSRIHENDSSRNGLLLQKRYQGALNNSLAEK